VASLKSEESLYRPVHDHLEQRFQERIKPAYGDLRFLSAITARAGQRDTGIWSKPDLCCVALWRYKYALGWSFDVHGFEVKTASNCDATAVHEALSHTSFVNFSHLVWEKPDWNERDSRCAHIRDRCARYGVGLITFADTDDVDTFVVHIGARRHEPAGDALDEFLETRLPKEQRTMLLAWIDELR
jgi:hypothetical protein